MNNLEISERPTNADVSCLGSYGEANVETWYCGATALSLALVVATSALAEGRGGASGMHARRRWPVECALAAGECTSVAVDSAVLKQVSALAELAQ
jgi:hypothetical protein